ncbi:MAG TPA: homoserine kinase [Gemmatimonadaceae bacterium]|jgi:homoserine kinase|nr:homoserine kinase [Gemmatimonadaceae bacterium]
MRVRVPGSTSNLGAGFDTIGLAVSRYLTAEYRAGDGPLAIDRRGTLASLQGMPEELDLFAQAMRSVCPSLGGTLVLDSEIPVGRGLGSSAAAVVGGLTLGAAVASSNVDVLRTARRWESHLDNVAPCLLGGLVAVVENEAFPLVLAPGIAFAYAAPGVPLSTARARAALPSTVPHSEAARALGHLAALIRGLETADVALLTLGLSDRLHVPYRLPLIPGGAEVREAGLAAGAWGVTVSGAGSGLLAVTAPEKAASVAEAMAAAFREAAGPEGVVAFPLVPDSRGVTLDAS